MVERSKYKQAKIKCRNFLQLVYNVINKNSLDMKSKVAERIAQRTPRRTKFHVKAYAKLILFGVRQRFHSYFDWKQFNIGIGFCKTTGLAGWQYMLSIDIAQFSMWIYFKKL